MKVLISGSRKSENFAAVDQALEALEKEFGKKIEDIVHGDAKGIDQMASNWAHMNIRYEHKYPANWNKHGKQAGMMRNIAMIVREKPDYVLAFPSKDSIGTWHMIGLAKEYDVPCRVIPV